MELSATTTATNQVSSQAARDSALSEDPSQSLDQTDFLKLMIAQVKNQDPFEPMDNGEFIGQMAQFSSVDGIKKMSTNLDEMAKSFQQGQGLQAATLVGRQVIAPTSAAILTAGQPVIGQVDLPGSTSSLVVEVKDAYGSVVRTMDLGIQKKGVVPFSWDGKNSEGVMQPDGSYYTAVKGNLSDKEGESTLSTEMAITVASVAVGSGTAEPQLFLKDGTKIGLSDVKQIN